MPLSSHAKRLLERLTGLQVERIGSRSFALIDPKTPTDAWCAPHLLLQQTFSAARVDLVVDAGANRGLFGREIRRFYAGDLHAFEPAAAPFAELTAAAAGDPQWQVHHVALGRTASTATLHVAANTVFSSILTTTAYGRQRFGAEAAVATTETVPVRRLDEVLRAAVKDVENRRIFLKIDTQGYDADVLAGLGDLVAQVVALRSEVSLLPVYERVPHWTESLASYESLGFHVAAMVPVAWDHGRVIEYDCLMVRA